MKRLGGDGTTTPTVRTPTQTVIGIYWGYDGTANLGAPPRLYNQIAVKIANQFGTGNANALDLARLLALVHMCDGGRRHRLLGDEVRLQVLAPRHRHPRGDRDGNLNTIVDRDLLAPGRAGQQHQRRA